jgi:hypothetical protein
MIKEPKGSFFIAAKKVKKNLRRGIDKSRII